MRGRKEQCQNGEQQCLGQSDLPREPTVGAPQVLAEVRTIRRLDGSEADTAKLQWFYESMWDYGLFPFVSQAKARS